MVGSKGIDLTTGPLLNISFHLLTSIAIFVSCLLLGCKSWASLVASILWFLSEQNMLVTAETRQYSLLGAIAIYFSASMIFFLNRPSLLSTLLVFFSSMLGLLTHYHFALLMTIFGFISGLHLLINKDKKAFLWIMLALGLSVLALIIIHPNFYMSFDRQVSQTQSFYLTGVFRRLYIFAESTISILWPVMIGFILLIYHYRSRIISIFFDHWHEVKILPFTIGALTIAVIGILYISFLSPHHAMGGKYLILATPLLFVSLGQMLNLVITERYRFGFFVIFGLLLIQVCLSIFSTKLFLEKQLYLSLRTDLSIFSNNSLILDSVARGVLPRILWHVPPFMPVWAGYQDTLQKMLMKNQNLSENILYVSNLSYGGNTLEGRYAVLKIFDTKGYNT